MKELGHLYFKHYYCFGCMDEKVAELKAALKKLKATPVGRMRHKVAKALNWFQYKHDDLGHQAVHESLGHVPGGLPVQLFQHFSGSIAGVLDPFEDRIKGAGEVKAAQLGIRKQLDSIARSPSAFNALNKPMREALLLVGFAHRNEHIQVAHRAMLRAMWDREAFQSFLPECLRFVTNDLDYMLSWESRNKTDAPVGILSRICANEYWLLTNVFGWPDEDDEDVRVIHSHLRTVLKGLSI